MEQPKVQIQSEKKRRGNFQEVSHGYPKRLAAMEALRCPQCADPVCMAGCPLGINIPGFIRFIREGKVAEAYHLIKEKNVLPSICGRVCSAPCELSCVLREESSSIGIRALERYAADHGRGRVFKRVEKINSGKKVAVIGSGPSGLSAAAGLARLGYQVTVFESSNKPGGVLRYGIPEFRLPANVLDQEIQEIMASGVIFETNTFVGKTRSFEQLMKNGFSAILLAAGAGVPKFMNLSGTNSGGVYYGEEFLARVNAAKTDAFNSVCKDFFVGEKVAVIGSGNTALDCARTALRFGRKVTMIFKKSFDDLKAGKDEVQYAGQEGILFEPLVKPIEILADQGDFVSGIKCVRMDYAQADDSTGWEIVPVPGSEFIIEADTVIISVGHNPNAWVSSLFSPAMVCNADGTIQIDRDTGQTSIPGIFACGNVVTNAGTVVDAIASGQQAAVNLDVYLQSRLNSPKISTEFVSG